MWTRAGPAAGRTTRLKRCSGYGISSSPQIDCFACDSFLTLKRWHHCAELLLFCDFIVAARPGFALEQINAALPKGVRNTGEAREAGFTRFTLTGASGESAELFLLADLDQDISATEIRAALAEGAEQQTVLAPAVAEYIRSHALYRPDSARDTIEAADNVGKSKEI
jgi:hypothetical protein